MGDMEDFSAMKVFELKNELYKRGLGVGGKKADLVQRLVDYEEEKEANATGGKKKSAAKAGSKKKAAGKKKKKVKLPKSQNTITSSSGEKILWQWAGDSPYGEQDTWIDYVPAMAKKLEVCFETKKKSKRKERVDTARYVDMTAKTFWQRRYDDPQRMRGVRRVEVDDSSDEEAEEEEEEEAAAGVASDDEILSDEEGDDEVADPAPTDPSFVHWYWAGDSPGPPMGHQDMWVVYEKAFCLELEAAFKAGKKRVEVDKYRFVDMQNMLQRRKSDINRRRMVKRVVPAGYVAKKATGNALGKVSIKGGKISSAAAGKVKAIQDMLDEEDEESGSEEEVAPKKKAKGKAAAKANAVGKKRKREDDEEDEAPAKKKAKKSGTDDIDDSPSGIQFDFPATWEKQSTLDLNEVDLTEDSAEFRMLSDMFESTIDSGHTGAYAYNHKVKFNTLEVTRVVRVQNPMLWLRYKHRKDTILHSKTSIPPVQKVLTGASTDSKANEFFLFHGLNENFIPGIARFGFDPRFCSLKGMFGAGIYFAEHSSKANQYCHGGNCTASGFLASASQHSCKCKKSGEAVMLVCRVTMGDTLVEKKYRGNYKATDYWHGRRTEPQKPGGGVYNGVVGESKKNGGSDLVYREYVVYESSQVYPEYIVYYKRK